MHALAQPRTGRRPQLMTGGAHQRVHLLPRPACRPGAMRHQKRRHSVALRIRHPESITTPGAILLALWLWIPGSARSLSSGRPKAGPVGAAPERRCDVPPHDIRPDAEFTVEAH